MGKNEDQGLRLATERKLWGEPLSSDLKRQLGAVKTETRLPGAESSKVKADKAGAVLAGKCLPLATDIARGSGSLQQPRGLSFPGLSLMVSSTCPITSGCAAQHRKRLLRQKAAPLCPRTALSCFGSFPDKTHSTPERLRPRVCLASSHPLIWSTSVCQFQARQLQARQFQADARETRLASRLLRGQGRLLRDKLPSEPV